MLIRPGGTRMTRDDTRLKRLLDDERTSLLADLAYFDGMEYSDIGSSNHLADDGTAAFDQASDQAVFRQLNHRLKRVEHALAKFDDESYGFCEGCGEPIDFARLKALPDARYCMNCQRRRESGDQFAPGPRAYEEGSFNS